MRLVCVVSLVVMAAWSLELADASAYDKIVSHSRIRARKEGPNTCALQQVMGTKKKYFSTCRNWYRGSICGKKAMVLYECCPGYMKLDGLKGCPAVAPIDDVYGTLGLVKATKTQEYSDVSEIAEELVGKGSYTMFAPSNDAWEQLDHVVKSALESNVNMELYNALHYHMVNRRLLTKDLRNDMSVSSMYNDLGLYINHYSNGVVTVNCARIVHGNQVATNGVVHVVDRVVSSVTSSIRDMLEYDDNLTSFNSVAFASGVMEKLGQPGHYTLFAPTNRAFETLGAGYLERIMGDKKIISALVNYHLLNSVQCGEAITAGAVYETAEGSTIEVGCDGDSLTVNGIKMVLKKDIVTTNGVIHLIDQVLVPDSAKEVMELVGSTQSVFTDMVAELGLSAALGPETEYTLLAPVNTAFTDEVMRTDQNLLKEILKSHILKQKVTLGELYNGQQLETLYGQLLRVFIYRTAVCIENSCMLRGGKEGSNGALHLMQSLIKPARKSIYEILVVDGRFKIFLSLIETAGLTHMLEEEGAFTVFAPTDDAFDGLTQEDLQLLSGDVNALRTILLYHFSNGVFINGGLEGGVTNLLKTFQGQNLQVLSVNNSIHVNSVDVPDNDLMATNGVIHVVKNILYPANLPVGREDLYILLKKLIKYIQIKYESGYSYNEVPITFFKRTITTTHYVETEPELTKVTRFIGVEPKVKKVTRVISAEPVGTSTFSVVEEEPVVTKVTRIIEVEPSLNTLTRIVKVDPSVTKVTRVVEGDPSFTKVTRVIEGEPTFTKGTRVVEGDLSFTKVTRVIEGDLSFTKGTRVVEGDPSFTKVTRVVEGDPSFTKVTRVVEGDPSFTKVTRVVEGDPSFTKVTRVVGIESEPTITKVVVQGEPTITQLTRMIERGDPTFTMVTRVIGAHSGDMDEDMKKNVGEEVTRLKKYQEVEIKKILEGGPDFSKITTIHGNPNLIDAESERISKLIREGRRPASARRLPVGVRRRPSKYRRHSRRRQ